MLARIPGKEESLKRRLQRYEHELQGRVTSSAEDEIHAETAYDAEFARKMGEKYRYHRTDTESELRKSFELLLSETEIKRRVAEIPNPVTFLMTYDETLKMQRETMARERKRELERLRRRREEAERQAALASAASEHPAVGVAEEL
jgi:hypothetical protein